MQINPPFEKYHAQMIDAIGDAVIVTDLNGVIQYWNQAAEKLYQWHANEVIGKNILKISPSEALRLQDEEIMQSLAKGETWASEFEVQCKDGSCFLAHITDVPIRNHKGEWIGIIGISRSISERKKTEETVKTSQRNLQTAQEIGKMGSWIWHTETNLMEMSDNLYAILGLNKEDGVPPIDKEGKLVHPDDQEQLREIITKSLMEKKPYSLDYRIFRADNGKERHLHIDTEIEKIQPSGHLIVHGIVQDITEQKRAAEKLKESEEKYKALYDNAPLAYQSLNEDGHFLDINPTWLTMLGYDREEVIGAYFADFLHPDSKPNFDKNFAAFKKRGYVHDVQFKIRHKDGHHLDISFEGCIGYNPDGTFRQTYCVFQDISKRKKAEQRSARFSRLFDESLNEIYLFKTDTWQFTHVNSAAVQNLGHSMETLHQMTPIDIKPEFTQELFEELILPLQTGEKENIVFETVHKRKDESIYDVEVHLHLLKQEHETLFAAIILDITQRKKTADELRHRIAETERINDLYVGREGRMINLKREVNALLEEVGRPAKYSAPEQVDKLMSGK